MLLQLTEGKPADSQTLHWRPLKNLGLSVSARAERMRWIGGSDANVILSGNTDRIRELWLEKRGEVNPKDLSSNLAVMLGCWTEPFNRQWFEVITGRRVSRAGDCLSCDRYSWRRCTLDGFVEEAGAMGGKAYQRFALRLKKVISWRAAACPTRSLCQSRRSDCSQCG